LLFSIAAAAAETTKTPVEAIKVARGFVNALNKGSFAEAYEFTDKRSKIRPAWFSSLVKFTERARHERPLSGGQSGESKIESTKVIDPKTVSIEFLFQFEVRLCRQNSNDWKVCYFQTHAG
jgi:hypothetical protein